MFCYFNDTAAFLEYLRAFRGRLLLVAGPVAGPRTTAHCHPDPFSADIPAPWALEASAAIAGTEDAVAVYTRPRRRPPSTHTRPARSDRDGANKE